MISFVDIQGAPMSNKKVFISTYLEKIAGKFNINKDQVFEIFSMAAILDKTFNEIYADVIILCSADRGKDMRGDKSAY